MTEIDFPFVCGFLCGIVCAAIKLPFQLFEGILDSLETTLVWNNLKGQMFQFEQREVVSNLAIMINH
jgi:hypothetical protein